MQHVYYLITGHKILLLTSFVKDFNIWCALYFYIRMRDYKHKEAYVGMFSQIGELYNVKVGNKIF